MTDLDEKLPTIPTNKIFNANELIFVWTDTEKTYKGESSPPK